MRVCFLSRSELSDFCETYGGSDADVLFFGFNSFSEEINYERELKGETSCFEDIAILSKQCNNVVICACQTDTLGFKRRSVVVAEKGRILGVSDMMSALDGAFNPGAGLKVYDTKIGKIGLCVSEDLYFADTIKTLSLCGAEWIFCAFDVLHEWIESVLIRSAAFTYGVPCLLCGRGYSFVADISGKLCFASPQSPIDYTILSETQYHLVEMRKRGLFTRVREGF